MKRAQSIFSLVLVGAIGFALPADAHAAQTTKMVVPLATNAQQTVPAPESDLVKTPVTGPPPCPVPRSCGAEVCQGSQSCHPVGVKQTIDTGLTSCTTASGSILACPPGKTVKYKQRGCGQCPCCSQQPGCICPIDCGLEISAVGCL